MPRYRVLLPSGMGFDSRGDTTSDTLEGGRPENLSGLDAEMSLLELKMEHG